MSSDTAQAERAKWYAVAFHYQMALLLVGVGLSGRFLRESDRQRPVAPPPKLPDFPYYGEYHKNGVDGRRAAPRPNESSLEYVRPRNRLRLHPHAGRRSARRRILVGRAY